MDEASEIKGGGNEVARSYCEMAFLPKGSEAVVKISRASEEGAASDTAENNREESIAIDFILNTGWLST